MENKPYIYTNGQVKGPLQKERPDKYGNYVLDCLCSYCVGHKEFDRHLKDLPSYDIVGQHSWKEGEILRLVEDFVFNETPDGSSLVIIPKSVPIPEQYSREDMLELIKYCASESVFMNGLGDLRKYLGPIAPTSMPTTKEEILTDFLKQKENNNGK